MHRIEGRSPDVAGYRCGVFPNASFQGPDPGENEIGKRLFHHEQSHDPCTSCLSGNHPSNIWTRAVYYEGALAYYALSNDAATLNHAVNWGPFILEHAQRNATTNADDQCVGQDYIDLYRLDPTKSERIANIKTCIDAEASGSGVNYWTWIDAIQMSMPVFAKMGKQYGSDPKYFSKMYSLYNYPKTTLKLIIRRTICGGGTPRL